MTVVPPTTRRRNRSDRAQARALARAAARRDPAGKHPGRRSRERRHLALVVLALLPALLTPLALAGPAAATPAATQAPRIRIDFFGDSLTYQASPYLAADFNRSTTSVSLGHVFPGTALCDWLPDIEALTTADAPEVAVLQFTGNHYTPCISGYVPGSGKFLYKYASDLSAAITKLRLVGVRDVLVDLGPATNDPKLTWYHALQSRYVGVVKSFKTSHVKYAWAADEAVESPTDAYAATLPCLAHEADAGLCLTGTSEKVRSADGLHFCPTTVGGPQGQVGLCPVYASGAYRYSLGLSKTIWSWLPKSKPQQLPLAATLSTSVVSGTGGTTLTISGASFLDVRGVAFLLPLPSGNLEAMGKIEATSSKKLTVTSPDLERSFGTTSGIAYVAVLTSSGESPWRGLAPLELSY